MPLGGMTCIEDLRQAARRNVPRVFFDYVEAGSYGQETLRANRADFERIKLRQRVLVDVAQRDLSTTIAGNPARLPIALAPIGVCGMMLYRGNDRARLARRTQLASETGVPLIAVNDVLYHHPDRRELQDVLTCIREGITIDAAGWRLAANAERYLKPASEMMRLFRAAPHAIEQTVALHRALTFSLDELQYEYPDERRPGFVDAQEELVHLAWEGAGARYPQGIPESVRQALDHELDLHRLQQSARPGIRACASGGRSTDCSQRRRFLLGRAAAAARRIRNLSRRSFVHA